MIPGLKARRVEPDIDVVEIIGTLNLGDNLRMIESDLRRRIREGSRKLILDVSQLRYSDSAGLGMIIVINGEIEQVGGQLRIAGATGVLAKSFSSSHLDRVLLMYEDVESACKAAQ